MDRNEEPRSAKQDGNISHEDGGRGTVVAKGTDKSDVKARIS